MQDPNQRRNTFRVILFMIILGTLPFYLLGFWLWGTAPAANAVMEIPSATNTAIGADITPTDIPPTRTLRPTNTRLPNLAATPIQFNPPPRPTNTQIPIVIPTTTLAPTLTPIIPTATLVSTATLVPTMTLIPPTDTPPTDIQPPTDPPVVATNTPLPFLPTGTLPPVILPPPSDTPQDGG